MHHPNPRRRFAPGRWAAALAAAALALIIYASTFVVSYGDLFRSDDPRIASDYAHLSPARVEQVDKVVDVGELQAAVRNARARGLKVSIAGSRHSQGGRDE